MPILLRLAWSASWFILLFSDFSFVHSQDSSNNNTTTTIPPSSSTNDEIQRDCHISGLYCSPRSDDNWYINEPHILRWNNLDPTVPATGTLNIQLFLSDDTRDPIYMRTDVANGDGSFPILVSRSQFYMFNNNSNSNTTVPFISKKAWFTLTPNKATTPPLSSRVYFNIIDPSPSFDTISVSSSSSSPSSSSDVQSSPSTKTSSSGAATSNSGLPVYAITLIVLSCVALAIAFLLLIFFAWRRRQKDNQLDIGLSEKVARETCLDPDQRPCSTQSSGINPSGSRSSAQTDDSKSPLARKTNLSANDAIMLSETFRELLRKPSWVDESSPDSRELDNSPSQPDESISIRLEEELALDGVGLLELDSKRNLTVIHDIPDTPGEP